MANIKKNFNFRNGVQVDDDNLLVTATGLVGIGTTVPTEALDVRGDVTVTGFASITSGNIGFLTVTTLEPVQIIGTGVSIKSGIVTAEGTGIVTFFGDARFLQGMPTSQWEDVDVGLGYTSIFNTGGNVGIATNDPRFSLEVGGKVDAGNRGVGISSVGNIRASGIITAVSFVGDLTGNIVSPSTFSGNIDLNADIDVDGHTNLDNVSITGVTTSSGNIDLNADLDVDGHTNLDNVSVSGVTTFATGTVFSGNIDINADIDVDGHTNLDNVSVSGVSTFTGLVDANGGSTIDNIQIGISGDNEIDTSTGNITIDSAGGTVSIDDDLGVTGIATFSQNVAVTGLTTTRTFQVVETSTFGGDIRGTFVGTSSTVFATKLGVGTTEAPVTEIQVRKSGDAEIQVTSETGTAIVSIGRTTNQVNGTNAEMRYGGKAGQLYSTSESFDLVNHGKDNFNYYLAQSNASSVRGDFHWLKGVSTRLMTLTNTGRLGIGITQPTAPLQVIGNSNISGDAVFGGDVNVSGTVFSGVEGNITGDVTGVLFGNVDASNVVTSIESKFKRVTISGITTASDVVVSEKLSISGNYLDEGHRLNINTTEENKFIVTNGGRVGVGTTTTSSKLTVNGSVQTFESLTVGATARKCAVDFADAGKNVSGVLANKMFMLPPKITTTERNALTGLVSGALIYNTSTNKLQVYDGSGWDNCN